MNCVHFETLGCKLNQIESESASRSFSDVGFLIDMVPETASRTHDTKNTTVLCVINTCAVTSKSEQKARRIIKLLLKQYPSSVILVTGCYAQLSGKEIAKIDSRITILIGTKKDYLADFAKIFAEKLEELKGTLSPDVLSKWCQTQIDFAISSNLKPITRFKLSTDTFMHHSRASIKIQDGCNNSCTFCTIHIARGESVSLEPEKILERIKQLEKTNQQEVVLTGVNLTQYKGLIPSEDRAFDFAQLLKYLLQNTKNISFRISSLYPQSITDELCSILKDERIQPHFHLSVQSGSNKILMSMGRPYTHEQVKKAVDKIRLVKPDAFIACDIIVGFAGETEEDFQLTKELCTSCNFSYIHVFPFSPRPGTKGYIMKPVVPQAIATKRVQELSLIAENNKKSFITSQINKELLAIVEKRSDRTLRCVTSNFIHTSLVISKEQENKLTNEFLYGKKVIVKITALGKSEDTEAIADIIKVF